MYQHIDLTTSVRRTVLAEALGALEQEFELPVQFPGSVLEEAKAAVAAYRLPGRDLTDIGFVTIDPPTSTDLDQAVHISRDGHGYVVHYAIADVPGFVADGGALDAETRRRGQTLYLPQRRIALHPDTIGEEAGSLLPQQRRGAYVWRFALDDAGRVVETRLERATILSRAKLSYAEVQEAIDAGTASESLLLLKEVGLKRVALEHERGGASLRLPEQEIETDDGGFRLVTRAPLLVEDWNAQISLMTGMEAARIMLEGGVGILRTMPGPDPDGVASFRRRARALGRPWPHDMRYGDFLRSLDVGEPAQLALMHAATSLFRGAGYTAFDGEPPAEREQAAIAAPYAHTTAPLRRLVDRFVLVVCDHLLRGEPVPEPVRAALPLLPDLMQASNTLAGRVERAAVDVVEAARLHGHIGELFEAVVIEAPTPEQLAKAREENRAPYGSVQLRTPAITARCEGVVEAGLEVTVRLEEADIQARRVLFRVVDEPADDPGEAP